MEDPSTLPLLIALAAATPVLAGLIHLYARSGAIGSLRKGRLWLLALAGPLNLVAWLLFNKRLEDLESRSTIGIVLAIVVFVVVGFGFGFIRRRDSDPDSTHEDEEI